MRLRVVMMVGLVAACGMVFGEEKGKAPPFTVGKETTGIVGPLREDGTVDYVGAMNEKYGKGVKAEENAFVGWLEVVGTRELVLDGRMAGELMELCGSPDRKGMKWRPYGAFLKARGVPENAINGKLDDEELAAGQLWGKINFELLADYLEEKGEYLDAVKEAFGRKKYWMPYVSTDGRTMMNVLLPSLARMRDAANGLAGRATFRAKAGDFDGCVGDVVAMKRMARGLCESGFLIERLVGVAIDARASLAIGAVAGSGTLKQEQAAALSKALAEFGALPSMAECADVVERWSMLDAALLLATGKGEMLRYASYAAEMFPGVEAGKVDWDAVMKRINGEVDEWVKATKKPTLQELQETWKRIGERLEGLASRHGGLGPKEDEKVEAYTKRVGDAIFQELASSMGRAEELRRRAVMQGEMARALVAAAGYRAARGKWPGKLGDLVPEYLKEMPRDIYSEGGKGEVAFELVGEGAKVVSIGPRIGSNTEKRKAMEVGAR